MSQTSMKKYTASTDSLVVLNRRGTVLRFPLEFVEKFEARVVVSSGAGQSLTGITHESN